MSRNAEQDRSQDLFKAAQKVRENAHAPYSNFKVGAAILAGNDKIYVGCNVENAAYPEGLCAEAGAIAALIADGEKKIRQVCIVGAGQAPVTPCGGCRQKLREFGGPDLSVLVGDLKGIVARFTLEALLPHSFGPDNLETTP